MAKHETQVGSEETAGQACASSVEALLGAGSWRCGAKYASLSWSDGLYAIYEVEPGTKPSHKLAMSLVHADDRKAVNAAYRALTTMKEPLDLEYRLRIGKRIKHVRARARFDSTAAKIQQFLGTVQDITEEKAEWAANVQRSDTLQSLRESIAVTDAEGRIIDGNDWAGLVTGHSLKEMLGCKGVDFMLDPEAWPGLQKGVLSALAKDNSWSGEVWLRHKKGHPVLAELHIVPRKNSAGKVTGVLSVSRDVTGAFRDKERLERQSQFLEQMSDAVHLADLDGNIVDCNQGLCELTGYDRNEIIGQSSAKFAVDEEAWRGVVSEDVESLKSVDMVDRRVEIRLKDGEMRVCSYRKKAFHDSSGAWVGNIVVSRDITDQLETENVIRRHALVLAQMKDAVLIVGTDGRISDCNAAVMRTFGFGRKALIGQAAVVMADNKSAWEQSVERALSVEGQAAGGAAMLDVRRPDAHVARVEATAFPLFGEARENVGYALILRDVTEAEEIRGRLEQSDYRLKAAQGIARIGHWEAAPNLESLIWSDEIYSILELDPVEHRPNTEAFLSAVHPGDRAFVESELEALAAAERPSVNFSCRICTLDGLKHVCARGHLIRDTSGSIERIFGTLQDVTAEREQEIALSHQAQIMSQIKEAIVVSDLDGVITDINEAVIDILGYTPTEMIGRHSLEFMDDADTWGARRKEVLKIVQDKGVWSDTVAFRTKFGERLFLELRMSPLLGDDNELLGTVSFAFDVTEREEAFAALKQSEARLAQAERMASIGYWETQPDLSRTKWTDEMKRIFGLSPDDPEPGFEEYVERIHPDDREAYLAFIEDFRETKEPTTYEYRFLIDGVVKYVQSRYSCRIDKAGNLNLLYGTVQDITAERETERSLAHQTRIISRIRAAFVVADPDSVITDVNEAMVELLGYERSELIGRRAVEFIEESEGWMGRREAAMATARNEGTWSGLLAARTKSGDKVILELQIASLFGEGDEFLGVVAFAFDVTAREEAVIALKQSEARLAQAEQVAKMGYWETSPDLKWTNWTDETKRIFGLAPEDEELGFEDYVAHIHPGDRESFLAAFGDFIAGTGPAVSKYRIVVNGETKYLLSRHFCRFGEDGKPELLFGTLQDITEQQRAERALRRSEARLREAQAIAQVGHWESSADLTKIEWSDEFRRIFGIDPDTPATTEEIYKRLHPEDADAVAEAFTDLSTGSGELDIEYRAVTAEGVKHIRARAHARRDDMGKIVETFGTVQDITRQKEADLALAEAREQAQRYLKVVGAIIYAVDAEGKVTLLNRAGSRILGYSEEEVVGRDWFDTVVPEDERERRRARFRRRMEGQEEIESGMDSRVVTASGEERMIRWQISALRRPDGSIGGLLGSGEDITERQKAEEALRLSEAQLAEAQRLANMGHWEIRLGQAGLYWSDEMYRILGYDPKEVEPSRELYVKRVHPDDLPRIEHFLNEELYQGYVSPEIRYRLVVDGETKFVHSRNFVRKNAEGEPAVVFGTLQDMTALRKAEDEIVKLNETLEMRVKLRTAELLDEIRERRRAEERVLAEKKFSDQLIDVAAAAIVVLGPEGKITRFNRYLEELSGYREEEVVEKEWSDILAPEFEKSRLDDMFLPAADGHLAAHNILSLRTRSGELKYLEWHGAQLSDDEGTVTGLLAVGQDVTEVLRDQGRILELSRRNEMILNAAGEGIFGLDVEGRCSFINPAGSRMLGLDPDEIVGELVHDLFQPADLSGNGHIGELSPIEATLRSGKVHTVVEESFLRADGSAIPVEYTSTPLLEDDRISGAVVVFRDMTQARHLQAQVVQASKLATLGEMATGVAHELNQPLNVIRLATDNIRRRHKKKGFDEAYLSSKLERIEAQIRRAGEIIEHMRIFGRPAGRVPGPVGVGQVVESSLRLIGEQLRLRQIEVLVDVPEDDGMVMGHAVQIEQVMLNLLGNARDAIESLPDKEAARQIRIVVGRSQDDAFATISVADTGPGLEDGVQDRIFDPFFTTKEVGEGTGLGLSISYGIVRDMGGTIEAHNGPDGGAVFVVSLPLVKSGFRAVASNGAGAGAENAQSPGSH